MHYEYLYSKLIRFEIKLPEGVQAYFLLKAANISEENERLARATCGEMKYENMKECIKNFFGDSTSGGGSDGGAPAVRSEPVFQSSHHEDVNYTSGSSSWRGRGQGRGRGFNMSTGLGNIDQIMEQIMYLEMVISKIDTTLEQILLIRRVKY